MSIRAEKVASVVQKALVSPITSLASENQAGLVTITAVRLSSDLSVAKVYLSVYGGKMSPGSFISLVEQNKPSLRSHIGRQVRLRHTPELRFFLDDTLNQMEHIQNLINNLPKPKDSD